jgi:cathepsin F
VAPEVEQKFAEFLAANRKSYASVEERAMRLAVFAENLMHIEHLRQVEEGDATYSHLSPFADISQEEFSRRHGLKAADWAPSADAALETLDATSLPESFDWREKGAVNDVKNQEQCGSCWAFATVANIEGVGFVSNGKLLSLSEQQLVDCDKATGDQGCGGGLPSNAFKDLIQKKTGLEPEKVYPYQAQDGMCQAATSQEVAFISGWKAIDTDEDRIAAALMQYGPLAIGINASPMQFYFGGISKPWKILCNPKKLDHGVAIVGFGVEGGRKYWTIRNSWGPAWGEKGYYRLIRGTGACGVNTMVSTATGVTFHSASSLVV